MRPVVPLLLVLACLGATIGGAHGALPPTQPPVAPIGIETNLAVLARNGVRAVDGGPAALGARMVVSGWARSSGAGALVTRGDVLVRCRDRLGWEPEADGRFVTVRGVLSWDADARDFAIDTCDVTIVPDAKTMPADARLRLAYIGVLRPEDRKAELGAEVVVTGRARRGSEMRTSIEDFPVYCRGADDWGALAGDLLSVRGALRFQPLPPIDAPAAQPAGSSDALSGFFYVDGCPDRKPPYDLTYALPAPAALPCGSGTLQLNLSPRSHASWEGGGTNGAVSCDGSDRCDVDGPTSSIPPASIRSDAPLVVRWVCDDRPHGPSLWWRLAKDDVALEVTWALAAKGVAEAPQHETTDPGALRDELRAGANALLAACGDRCEPAWTAAVTSAVTTDDLTPDCLPYGRGCQLNGNGLSYMEFQSDDGGIGRRISFGGGFLQAYRSGRSAPTLIASGAAIRRS